MGEESPCPGWGGDHGMVMALTQEAAGETLGEAGVRPVAVPGARRQRAGDTNSPGSRPGCRGSPHGQPPTPPPAPAGAAPVPAWWGRGLGVPRPHAGHSPAAPVLAPRAPPPPPAPASCSVPGHPAPCMASATALGWGLLFPHRPPRAPCPGTLGEGLWPHTDELAPWHGHGARLAPGSRRGGGTWCGNRARTGCAQTGVSFCPSVLQRSTGQPPTLQRNKKFPHHTRETTGQGEITPLLLPPQTKSCW